MNVKVIQKRVLFGSVMIILLVGIFFLDHLSTGKAWQGIPMVMFFLPVLIMGFFEFRRMAKQFDVDLLVPSGIFGICILCLQPLLVSLGKNCPLQTTVLDNQMAVIALILILLFVNQMAAEKYDKSFSTIGFTLLACIYIGMCGGVILSLRIAFGVKFLIMFLASVKCTDIGAFFTGTLIGKHKIVPRLSPGKTFEGLVGGLCFAAAAGFVWSYTATDGSDCWKWVIFSSVTGLVGQFGDLCESLLKRSAGVKDSGQLLPEFGGILDLIDSPLIAAPVAYVILYILNLDASLTYTVPT